MEQPVERQYQDGHRDLYIFFGGIRAGIQIPPFEFYRASNILNEHKLFIRDLDQSWYHAGLRGITRDIQQTADFLRREIAQLEPQRTVFIGNSMGGFAAILFATMLDTGSAVAFSPQTFISPMLRRKHGDRRWAREIRRTYLRSIGRTRIWDLRTHLKKTASSVPISVYFGKLDATDQNHADHIGDFPQVSITGLESREFKHNVVKMLRDLGELERIIKDSRALD